MANEQNLAPKFQPGKRAREMGRKGGKVKSIKKTQASRLSGKIRSLKRKGELGDQEAKELAETLSDPSLSSLELKIYLKKIQKTVDKWEEPNIMLKLADHMIKWHKMHHGEKIDLKTDQVQAIQIIINDERNKYPVIDPEEK